MDATQCKAALAELARLDPPHTIFGGVANDLVLYGDIVRDHGDVDVLVMRPDVSGVLAALGRIGFGPPVVYFEEVRGLPLVVGTQKGASQIELGVFDEDEAGDVYFVLKGEAQGFHRIYLPAGATDNPPIEVDGLEVRTVTPLALFHITAGLDATGSFGPLRPKDLTARAEFQRTLLADADPGILVPRVEPVPPPVAL